LSFRTLSIVGFTLTTVTFQAVIVTSFASSSLSAVGVLITKAQVIAAQ